MGMEDKTFPHERSTREGALEEERRLFYVAVTRAKTNLVITFSLNRMAKGKMARKVPSRFLKHIPEEYADKIGKNEFFKPMDRAELLNAMDKIFEMLK
jgi:DNA helicase-2/ATP-dependent DNA helicase PcrA